jgi:hypothetical protein
MSRRGRKTISVLGLILGTLAMMLPAWSAQASKSGLREMYLATVRHWPSGRAANAGPRPFAMSNPTTVMELKDAITAANTNNADDIIDLGGQTFTLIAGDNVTSGSNGLPSILSDGGHKLLIKNGRIERSTADSTPLFRLFYINKDANLTLNRVTVANGRAFSDGNGLVGGGLFNQGVLTLNSCTVAGNQASGSGGGIYNLADDAAPTATVTLNRCTVAGNSSTSTGGGIVNAGSGAGNTATLVINNSTISGNSASQQGGGIENNSAGTMTINNSTIVGNSASSSGGGINAAGSVVSIGGCIIARNRAMGGPDINASVTSQGYNLIGDKSNSDGFTQPTDQTGTQAAPLDPKLELDGMGNPLLKDNGGPTQTIALLATSPALDKGKQFGSATTDQRGVSRPMDDPMIMPATGGDDSDIGAFEAIIDGCSTVVSNLADSGGGSLRCAIASAFTGANITFGLGAGVKVITLTSGQLLIDKDVTIQGLGANRLTVQRSTAGGTPDFRIFEVKGGTTVAISGLTIANGKSTGSGLGSLGGGLFNQGVLTLNSCTVAGNSGSNGGGLANRADDSAPTATLTLNHCTISGNSATGGGGGGGIHNVSFDAGNTATLVVNNSTIAGNSANSRGGGIQTISASNGTGTMTLTNSTIAGNSAEEGGGISLSGPAPIGGCIIARNSAQDGPDLNASVTSQGYNLIGDATFSGGFTQPTDQTGTQASPLDPKLELDGSNKPLLKDNGGPTQTIALLCGSPAIDKGKNLTAATTDQRGAGFPRTVGMAAIPTGDGTDIGAFEQVCNQPPVARCQNVTVSAGASCTASASIDNGSSDPDAGDMITLTQSPAGPYAKGQTMVTLTVTDSHNASSQCTATVTVVDNTAPTITCAGVAAQSASTNASCAATVPDVTGLVRAQANDNCTLKANLVITQSPTANSTVSGTGSHPITVTVKDADNNSQTCVVGFTLNDTTAPTINCANVAAQSASTDGNCSATVPDVTGMVRAQASDNCTARADLVITQNPTANSTVSGAGSHPITVTVKDADNNSQTCVVGFTLTDTTAPTIACANVAAQSASTDGNCAAMVPDATALVRAQASDNCTLKADLVITQSPTANSTVSGTGSHPITVTVKDAANNATTCVVGFTLNDTTKPTINCPANIAKSTDPNQCAAVVAFNPTASDNCSGVGTPVCTPPSGSSFSKGTTSVTCTVKDAANNQSLPCSFTVTVVDMQPPAITCPANITVPAASGQCGATVSYNAPSVSDNCPGVSAPVCNPPSGTSFPKGTTMVNCTVKDAVNNQSACAFPVTVIDTQAPSIACPANLITNTINAGEASVAVNFAAPMVSDNCPGVGVVCVPPSGSQFPRGTTTVTCTATDAANNQTSCAFTVRVFDYVIVDDTNGKILRFLSTTGDYDFFDCRKNKSLSGRGTVTILACKTTLSDTKPDRTVSALANTCTKVGNATVTTAGLTHTLNDANLSNNIVSCP